MFLPQLLIVDNRQTRKNLTTKFKNLATRLEQAVELFNMVETSPKFLVLKNNGIQRQLNKFLFLCCKLIENHVTYLLIRQELYDVGKL